MLLLMYFMWKQNNICQTNFLVREKLLKFWEYTLCYFMLKNIFIEWLIEKFKLWDSISLNRFSTTEFITRQLSGEKSHFYETG